MSAPTRTRREAAPTTTTNESPLLDQVILETAAKLDQTALRYRDALADEQLGHLHKAMLMARGIQALRAAITPEMMKLVMSLQNSPLGFKTDKEHGYPENVVKECLVASLLEGFYPFGNEWNIISGSLYGALEGWKRKCEEIPGITDLRVAPGIPYDHNGQKVVRVAASWVLSGIPGRLIGPDGKEGHPFAIIARAGATPDNLTGKARRKAYKMVFERITGTKQTFPDADVTDPPETPGKMEQLTETMKQKAEQQSAADGKKPPSPKQVTLLRDLTRSLNMSPEELADIARRHGAERVEDFSAEQISACITELTGVVQERHAEEAEREGMQTE